MLYCSYFSENHVVSYIILSAWESVIHHVIKYATTRERCNSELLQLNGNQVVTSIRCSLHYNSCNTYHVNKVSPREATNIILQWNLNPRLGDISSNTPAVGDVTTTTLTLYANMLFELQAYVDLKMKDNSHYNGLTKSM